MRYLILVFISIGNPPYVFNIFRKKNIVRAAGCSWLKNLSFNDQSTQTYKCRGVVMHFPKREGKHWLFNVVVGTDGGNIFVITLIMSGILTLKPRTYTKHYRCTSDRGSGCNLPKQLGMHISIFTIYTINSHLIVFSLIHYDFFYLLRCGGKVC